MISQLVSSINTLNESIKVELLENLLLRDKASLETRKYLNSKVLHSEYFVLIEKEGRVRSGIDKSGNVLGVYDGTNDAQMKGAILLIAFLSFIVWGHHMFMTGMDPFLGSVRDIWVK